LKRETRWTLAVLTLPVLTVLPVLTPLGPGPLGAQELPDADALIAAHVEAIGGREANLAPTSIRQIGTVTVLGIGISGDFEIIHVLPDRMLTRIALPGMGEVLSGFDGGVGWSLNPLLGPMLMEGDELVHTGERSHVLAGLRDDSLVPHRETVGLSDAAGEPCWRVRMTWVSGRESFDCFSTETGLLVASDDRQSSQMGEVPVRVEFGDYRTFDGMTLATRILQSSMGQEMEIVIRSVEIDDVELSRIEPPAAVRSLLEARSGN